MSHLSILAYIYIISVAEVSGLMSKLSYKSTSQYLGYVRKDGFYKITLFNSMNLRYIAIQVSNEHIALKVNVKYAITQGSWNKLMQ